MLWCDEDAQMEFPFYPFVIMDENMQDGFNTGLGWTETYRPGGPWAYDAASHRERERWLDAFDTGLLLSKQHSKEVNSAPAIGK